jgi:hypothetical protein
MHLLGIDLCVFYGAVNHMREEAAAKWAKDYKILLMLPMTKFVMGSMAYMASVIIASWRDLDLDGHKLGQIIASSIGIMSAVSVWCAFYVIQRSIGFYNKGTPSASAHVTTASSEVDASVDKSSVDRSSVDKKNTKKKWFLPCAWVQVQGR